eukprot:TRINITY_DN44928_c0_g1_i1.p1 TRINITY_DN44928_c0_g1~~TRINITY_DN44928_c0_g1_i1.p1  ORF type:complete len:305 (-),score=36.16 TRINITY_DN44928_c0_g1_i1:38-952(-)
MVTAMRLYVAVTACLSSVSASKVLRIQTYSKDGCVEFRRSFFLQHFNFGTCSDGPRMITKINDTAVQLTYYKDWNAGCNSTLKGFSNILKQINVTSTPSCHSKTEYTVVTLPPGYATINYTRFIDFNCESEDSQKSVNPIVQIAGPACEPTSVITKNGAGFRKRRCSSTNTLTEDFYSDPACTGNPFRSLQRGACLQADGESFYWRAAMLCPTTTSTTTASTTASQSAFTSTFTTSTSMPMYVLTSSTSVFTSSTSVSVFASTPTSTSRSDSAQKSVAVARAFQHRAHALLFVVFPTVLGAMCA